MVGVAQLVRALVCGTKGRGFESHFPPEKKLGSSRYLFFFGWETHLLVYIAIAMMFASLIRHMWLIYLTSLIRQVWLIYPSTYSPYVAHKIR